MTSRIRLVPRASRAGKLPLAAPVLALLVAAACKTNSIDVTNNVTIGVSCVPSDGDDASKCPTGAVCAAGRCRIGCATGADCDTGECVIDTTGKAGCRVAEDLGCSSTNPCAAPLVCASDSTCRNSCTDKCDVPGTICKEGVCVAGSAPPPDASPPPDTFVADTYVADTYVADTYVGDTSAEDTSPTDTGSDTADTPPPPPFTLELVDGAGQSAYPFQSLTAPIRVKLVDTTTGAPQASVDVSIAPIPGMQLPATVKTNSSGIASVLARNPLDVGSHSLRFSVTGAAPLSVAFASTAPAAGTVFTLTGPSELAVTNVPLHVTTGSKAKASLGDGRMVVSMVSSAGALGIVDAAGQLTTLLRSGAYNAGDGGPLSGATAGGSTYQMNYSTTQKLVIFFDGSIARQIDLATGTIDRYAGGGTDASLPTLATNSDLSKCDVPNRLLGESHEGDVFLGTCKVSKTGIVSKWFTFPTSGACTSTLELYPIGTPAIIPHPTDGFLYAGQICGTTVNDSGGNGTSGIVHVSSTGTLTRIAGKGTGSTAFGATGLNYKFEDVYGLAQNANEYFVAMSPTAAVYNPDFQGGVVAISKTTGIVRRVYGAAVSTASTSEYTPAVTESFEQGQRANPLFFLPNGNLVVIENNRTRMIWNP